MGLKENLVAIKRAEFLTKSDGATFRRVLHSLEALYEQLVQIQSGVTTTLVGDLGDLDTKIDIIDGIVDSILEDTGTTLPATLATIDGIVDAILVDTGTTLPGLLSTIDTVVDAIKAKTDNLPSDPADQSLLMAAIAAISTGGRAEFEQVTYTHTGDTNFSTKLNYSGSGIIYYISVTISGAANATLQLTIDGEVLTSSSITGASTIIQFSNAGLINTSSYANLNVQFQDSLKIEIKTSNGAETVTCYTNIGFD